MSIDDHFHPGMVFRCRLATCVLARNRRNSQGKAVKLEWTVTALDKEARAWTAW